MKLVGICIFRNEADVIESMLRYNLQYLDEIHVVNHLSTDSSADIVQSMIEEGLPIQIEHEHEPAFIQNRTLTRLMRKVSSDRLADFVVPLDADECITGNGAEVRSTIQQLPADMPSRIAWRTYIPCTKDNANELNPIRRITHHLEQEFETIHKIMIPRQMATDTRFSIGMGSHYLVDERKGKAARKVHEADNLRIAHFPVRSAAQIMSKAFAGWLSFAANPDRKANECLHWKWLYDRFSEGVPPDISEVTRLAVNYIRLHAINEDLPSLVESPLPAGGRNCDLRYANMLQNNPVGVLARNAEAIALEAADVKRRLASASARKGIFRFWR